jgi:hypothetical protein
MCYDTASRQVEVTPFTTPRCHLSIVLQTDSLTHPSLLAAESDFTATAHESSFSSKPMGADNGLVKPGKAYGCV